MRVKFCRGVEGRGVFFAFLCGGVFRVCVDIFFFFSFWKRPRETDGGETTYFFLQAKHIEEDYHYSALFLSTCGGKEKERERERERRTHDATTRGSNARRIATMTAAEDVQTRPLTEYIFGFFSL